MPPTHSPLQGVLQHPAVWRGARAPLVDSRRTGVATGFAALDQALPDGGWPRDGVAELLCPEWGCGEAELVLPLLRQLSNQPRWLVWINPPWLPYAPALAQQGVALEHTLLLRSEQDRDLLWAMEQCLASGSCSLVQGWPARPGPQQIRRLQLAAQKGHSLGLLLRPTACARQPSPAPLRLELARAQQGLQARVVKCRGGWGSDWLGLVEAQTDWALPQPYSPPPLDTAVAVEALRSASTAFNSRRVIACLKATQLTAIWERG
jgi:cell division inhibitor SulA